ncbi:zinc-alpha-2-glycoprotein-like [Trichosurus vulpecula]|uniref:zinc-alpha-2-glycoprotein-like n=1 Tax=Trichosurus vulpecula TaxID=9337 RepID=UPI00186B5245|nr:zinc-alpha-2-glycoprotein-like [Trichosurus vulpecula]
MMGPLATLFFLLLFSGTTVLGHGHHKPRKQCDSLVYQDVVRSEPTPLFTNTASFNGKLIYQYDSDSERAVPEPGWDNVENWTQTSQIQKQRGDFAVENLQEIMNVKQDTSGSHVLSGSYGCRLCQNDDTEGFWSYDYDGKPFIEFDKEKPAWIPKDPEAVIIKQKWEEDPGAVYRAKSYLEETCIEELKKYRDYKKAN